MIRSSAYKVEFLLVFACVHNFACVCLTWFVSVLFWIKIGLHLYLAPAACNRGGKPGELFAQQPPLWAATHPNFFFPSTSTIASKSEYNQKCSSTSTGACMSAGTITSTLSLPSTDAIANTFAQALEGTLGCTAWSRLVSN